MKNVFLLIFFGLLLSCKNDHKKTLQKSHGKVFEILVVYDTVDFQKVNKTIEPISNLYYEFLPQAEKKYHFRFISLSNFLKSQTYPLFHHILFVSQHNFFGLNDSLDYARISDKWAYPQLLQFIKYHDKWNDGLQKVDNEAEIQNLKLIKSRVESWKKDTSFNFNNRFMLYPANFQKVKSKSGNYSVFKNEFKDGVSYIIMQISHNKPDRNYLISWRNKAMQSIFSDADSTSMVHEKWIAPSLDSFDSNILKYSLKGLWETRSDFKGGPFALYVFYDGNTKEYLYVDSFVFAPGKEKKTYMEELKTIIYNSFYTL